MATTEQRFWSKVDKSGECWLWTAVTVNGYGRFRGSEGRPVFAHRWSYEALIGPIPDGLQIDHLCRVRSCVNPAHLEPVTASVNTRRARSDFCKQGHPLVVKPSTGKRHCPICEAAYRLEWQRRKRESEGRGPHTRGIHQRRKTHCPKGHPYDEANTYVNRKGSRECRACWRLRNQRQHQERLGNLE